MPLPAKRKTEKTPPKNKSKMGMTEADSGKGKPKNVMNKGIGGLSDAQAQGGEEPEIGKKQGKSKPSAKKSKQGMY